MVSLTVTRLPATPQLSTPSPTPQPRVAPPTFGALTFTGNINLDTIPVSKLNPEKLLSTIQQNLAAALTLVGSADELLAHVATVPLVPMVRQLLVTLSSFIETLQKQTHLLGLATLKDALTGLKTRQQFDFDLKHRLKLAQTEHQPFALISVDADYFKHINDTHGHAMGDSVLKKLAADLTHHLARHLPEAQAYRVGGEEFMLLLPQATPEQTTQAMEAIMAKFAAIPAAGKRSTDDPKLFALFSPQSDKAQRNLSLSMGAILYDGSQPFTLPAETLKAHADQLLYQAKAQGRNRSLWVTTQGAELTATPTTLLGPPNLKLPPR
jgi:diguanylate cyclase (GGDEF)-like protein